VLYLLTFDSLTIDGTRKPCGPFTLDVYPPVLVYAE
jgi:hypothetical protein